MLKNTLVGLIHAVVTALASISILIGIIGLIWGF